MPNKNEIDDILNELKNKNRQNATEKGERKADDFFYSFTPPKDIADKISDEEELLSIGFDRDKKTMPAKNENTSANNFKIINDSFTSEAVNLNEIYTSSPDDDGSDDKKKKIIIGIIAAVVIIGIIVAAVLGFTKNKDNKEPETTSAAPVTTTEAPVQITNPLTGEADYNTSAVGKRPIACVVENASAARPQWGIDDSKNSPDIILEGEVEGGETRMLWFYADYTSLPAQLGPVRSARPPYIKFSELFDSIFIHWGQSSSRDNYVGADTVFKTDNVDHINQMTYSGSTKLFGRDSSRGVSSEHTGVLYGDMVEQAIKESEFRTDINQSNFSKFSFNKKEATVGETECTSFSFTFSANTKTRDWTYSTDDKMYHCTDYMTDVARKNLLVLYDNTEYISKQNYKGSGRAEIYCDYKLSGGTGKLVSLGTITDITWSVENGILTIKDTDGKTINLNQGTTWIGYGSSNHGGSDKNNTTAE